VESARKKKGVSVCYYTLQILTGHIPSDGCKRMQDGRCFIYRPPRTVSETPSTPLGRVATRHRPPRHPADIPGATTRPLATTWSPTLRQRRRPGCAAVDAKKIDDSEKRQAWPPAASLVTGGHAAAV
jgi:hypothetical protein